jgi:NAD(P)H dehydrogenase (quinone)
MAMVFVTGASGKLGRLVVECLIRRIPAAEVIAGARTPEKAQALTAHGVAVRRFDYRRPERLESALRGVERLLLISGTEPDRVDQHRAVIEAAGRAGVRLLAYTSGTRADTSKMLVMTDHRATERILRESGVPFVILRNCWYVENYTDNLEPLLEGGVLYGAAGDGRVSVAARADYAEAAAVVLTTEGHAGRVYELGGDRAHTLAEIAAEIARASGRSFVYRDLSQAELAAALQKAGVPAGFASVLADADTGLKRGELLSESGDLRRLLGRPTTPMAAAIEQALGGRGARRPG